MLLLSTTYVMTFQAYCLLALLTHGIWADSRAVERTCIHQTIQEQVYKCYLFSAPINNLFPMMIIMLYSILFKQYPVDNSAPILHHTYL